MKRAPGRARGRHCRRGSIAAIVVWAALHHSPLIAQNFPARESRAVWLTTLSGLDWPSAGMRGDAAAQQASLRSIFDNIRAQNLNTVLFQVRSRGNAFYASDLEPWAGELSGRLGQNPGWDPLAVAVEEAHARGLELHAWVNVFKVWSGGSPPPRTVPAHLVHAHPEWVTKYKDEYWIDPGVPAARDYLVRLFENIATRYDIDALHLDYARYPEADFDDATTWRERGRGTDKAAWRRSNVDAFVSALSGRLRAVKPRLRIGAAPIGIYESIPGARGWQGYHALGQDSRAWLRKGEVDYLSPQIYWGMKRRGSNVDFEALIADWQHAASGRTILAGMAPYKDDVRPWIGEMIDVARASGASGQAYFRYEHVRDGAPFAGRYASMALPAAAPWRDPVRPNPPMHFVVTRESAGTVLTWDEAPVAADGESESRYAVYRESAGATRGGADVTLIAVLPSGTRRYRDASGASGHEYYVTAIDRCNNESGAASSAVIAGRATVPSPSLIAPRVRMSEAVDGGDEWILLGYEIPVAGSVRLRLMDTEGAELAVLVDARMEAGTHVLGLDRSRIPPHASRCILETGTTTVIRDLAFPP